MAQSIVALSERTEQIVQKMFPQDQEEVRELLTTCHQYNQLMLKYTSDRELERIRTAVLKLSGGQIEGFRRAFKNMIEGDYRDVLVASDFAYPHEHGSWADDYLAE